MRKTLRAAGMASALLLVVVAASPSVPATETGTGSPAQADFTPGSGVGQGRLIGVQLRSSGVAVGIVAGRASARYQGSQGNAEALTFDPGLLGTLAQSPLVCGRAIADLVPLDRLPQPLKVSSGGGATSEREDYAGEGPIRFGTQEASAAPNSRAAAAVQGLALDIPGLLTINGGDARSSAELTPGQRVGRSRSEISSMNLGGGIVRLDGLVWTAEHLTGADVGANATFSVGSIRVAGLPVPVGTPAQLQRALGLANTALAPLGIEIGEVHLTSSETSAQSPPLRLTVAPTPLLLAAIVPLNEQIQPVRTALLDLLDPFAIGEDCNFKSPVGFAYLIVDLIVASMSSGGGVDLLVGGASAGTDDIAFENPFGSGTSLPSPTADTTTSTTVPPTTVPTTVATTTAPTTTTAPVPTEVAVAPSGTSETVCTTSHPVARPACSSGAAVLAGLLALGVVGVLAGVDRVRTRRPRPGGAER